MYADEEEEDKGGWPKREVSEIASRSGVKVEAACRNLHRLPQTVASLGIQPSEKFPIIYCFYFVISRRSTPTRVLVGLLTARIEI